MGFLQPLEDPGGHRAAARARCRRLRDGIDPANHPCPDDGRALVAGHDRRLQGRPARRRPQPEALSHADDGCRHDRPGARARARGRSRRAPGDRDRETARRGRLGLRRPTGCGGAGRLARSDVPRPRRARRGDRGRLRAGADGRAAARAAECARRQDPRLRRRRHHRGSAGAAGAEADPGADPSRRCSPAP